MIVIIVWSTRSYSWYDHAAVLTGPLYRPPEQQQPQQQPVAVQPDGGEAEDEDEATDQRQEDMATFDLFSAVKDGNTDSVRRLLESKHCRARLNDRNEWGDTVLHLAAEAGNSEVCQMLVAGGASVTVRNNRGETCLHRAAVGGHKECVRAIVGR